MSDFPQTFTKAGVGGILSPAGPVTPGGELGRILGSGYNQIATAWGTANRAVYQPVMLSDPATVDRFIIQVATTGGNVDVGLYDWGGVKRVSSGSVATGAAGAQVIDVTDTPLEPGWYYIAFACSSTTAVFRCANYGVGPARACGFREQLSALPLPANATFATYATAIAPYVGAAYTAVI